MLVIKDFKLRYRNSVLGFFWSLLNPLAMMAILTVFETVVFPSSVANYPVFILCGNLAFRFFSIATSQSLDSIVGNPSLVTKVALPRMLLVLSSNLANGLGSVLEFVTLIPVMVLLGLNLTLFAILLPLVLLLEFILIFGISLILSSLSVFYRDFNQIWEIINQALFFLTPIWYSPDIIPPKFSLFFSLNPVERIVAATRSVLYYGRFPTEADFVGLLVAGLLFLGVGLLIFHHYQDRFGELV